MREEQIPSLQQLTLLRGALRSNAAFSFLSGITAAFATSYLAELFGTLEPDLLKLLGVGLVGFATLVAWVSLDAERMDSLTPTIIAADVLWVVASIGLVVIGVFSSTGTMILSAIALAVALFAYLQWRGLEQARRARER